ncbi:MAG: cytochrome-c peroxidase, partial [Myxococcota bacterium]
GDDRTWPWGLPASVPRPRVPDDNPMSEAKVELGRRLFYDERLSSTGTLACAGCHEQERAFADGRALPVGETGDVLPRNAMSLVNVAYVPSFTWANPAIVSLEAQARIPREPLQLSERHLRTRGIPANPPQFQQPL